MRHILTPLLWTLCVSTTLSLSACQPESKTLKKSEVASAANDPLIQEVNGFQVTFEITTMAKHHEMMDAMKMTMDGHGDSMPSHYVMVTVLDDNKKPVADLPMKIKVIAPTGEALLDASGVSAEVMSGEGMVHYGHGFDLKDAGRYQVLVQFSEGGTPHQTGVYWEKPE